jgi:putative spermidine/putrescine transport system permease protein
MTVRGERLLTAYVYLVLAFLLLPILIVLPSAFSSDVSLTFPPTGFSLRWFRNIVDKPEFIRAFWISISVAAGASLISLVFGTAASLALVRKRFIGRHVISMLITVPIIFPAVVIAVAMVLALGPLKLTGTVPGLVLAHVVITLPYVVRTVSATLQEIDPSMVEAAQVLGASPWKAFRHVVLPLIRPGLIAGGTFAMVVSFDEFTISLFLTGPGLLTLPVQIYNYVEFSIDPTVAAISTVLIVMTVILVVAVERWLGLERHFRA